MTNGASQAMSPDVQKRVNKKASYSSFQNTIQLVVFSAVVGVPRQQLVLRVWQVIL
jgi:hypothetical protein